MSPQTPPPTPGSPRPRRAGPAAARRSPAVCPGGRFWVLGGVLVAALLLPTLVGSADGRRAQLRRVPRRGREPATSRRSSGTTTTAASTAPSPSGDGPAASSPPTARSSRPTPTARSSPSTTSTSSSTRPQLGLPALAAAPAAGRLLIGFFVLDEPPGPGPDGRDHVDRPVEGEDLHHRAAGHDLRRRRRLRGREAGDHARSSTS